MLWDYTFKITNTFPRGQCVKRCNFISLCSLSLIGSRYRCYNWSYHTQLQNVNINNACNSFSLRHIHANKTDTIIMKILCMFPLISQEHYCIHLCECNIQVFYMTQYLHMRHYTPQRFNARITWPILGDDIIILPNFSYKPHQILMLVCFSSHLAVASAQSIEGRC